MATLKTRNVIFSSRSNYRCPRSWGKPSEYATEHTSPFQAQATECGILLEKPSVLVEGNTRGVCQADRKLAPCARRAAVFVNPG